MDCQTTYFPQIRSTPPSKTRHADEACHACECVMLHMWVMSRRIMCGGIVTAQAPGCPRIRWTPWIRLFPQTSRKQKTCKTILKRSSAVLLFPFGFWRRWCLLQLCMYICIYVYMYICIYVYMNIRIYVYVQPSTESFFYKQPSIVHVTLTPKRHSQKCCWGRGFEEQIE